MGLFSDTKNFQYTLITNNPPFTFKDFKETFIAFIESDNGKSYFDAKGLSIEGELKLDDVPEEKLEMNLRSQNALSPTGEINVAIQEKGENQGYAVTIMNLDVTLSLKKEHKNVAKEIFDNITAFYNKQLNTENVKLMFTAGKNNGIKL